jgi:hypothetical protein
MSRRALVLLAALAVAGCGVQSSAGRTPPSQTGTPRPVVTVAAQPGPTDRPSGSSAPRTPLASPSGGEGVVDLSAQARSNFGAWYSYEVLLGPDTRRPESEVYDAGMATCKQVQTGKPGDLVRHELVTERGYGEPGAEAVFKAAVSALCTDQNLGYRTNFDREVDFAYQKIIAKVTYTPAPFPIYDYGFFAKETCNFMIQTPHPGPLVYDHMRAATWLRLTENGNVQPAVLNIYIAESVNAHCLDLFEQLPPIIQSA